MGQVGVGSDRIPAVPPGLVSFRSFTLQRHPEDVKDVVEIQSSNPSRTQIDFDYSIINIQKSKKSLRLRPWVNYGQSCDSSDEDSDSEALDRDLPSPLPKGILHGCAECQNCVKIMARWHPEHACCLVLDEAPVFYPSEEEFEDALKYISSIRPRAEPYGICRIVPPSSWRPPCPLKEKHVWESLKFPTRIQQVDKLQNRESVKRQRQKYSITKRKRQELLYSELGFGHSSGINVNSNDPSCYSKTERFGFEPGPDFTLERFQKYADDFKKQFFQFEDNDINSGSMQWEPSVENIEGEYWRIVQSPTEEIEVFYGADVDTGIFGSGFPKVSTSFRNSISDDGYVNSSWNLNNFARLPGSVLSYESGNITGILVPRLYIGTCFSSFCWHVEDHHLYSLNYMHWGAPKIWYGVPGSEALKLEVAMKKHLSNLFEEQPDLLHNLVTQFSPSMLKSEGVPVYRCVQNSGEFVLTFPRACHSGFNCGFNCVEAVNVAPVDWLPYGLHASELYREQRRKISLSYDKLLLGAAKEAVKTHWNVLFLGKDTVNNSRWMDVCGMDGILVKTLKARIELERVQRDYICHSSQSRKMNKNFGANNDKECVVCHFDLHFSAASCPCSPDRFACLVHARELCSCSWNSRFFLFRYEIDELNTLVDALRGKMSAVHKWARAHLGLSLSSVAKAEPYASKLVSENLLDGTGEMEKRHTKDVIQTSVWGSYKLCGNACVMQPYPLEEPEGKQKSMLSLDDSTCTVGPCSPSHQRTRAVVEEPCFPHRSLSGIVENQVLQTTERHKSPELNSSGCSGNQPSQGGATTNNQMQGSPMENSMNLLFSGAKDESLSNTKLTILAADKCVSTDVDVASLSDTEEEGDNTVLLHNPEKGFPLEKSEGFPKLLRIEKSGPEKVKIIDIPNFNLPEISQRSYEVLCNRENLLSLTSWAVKDQLKQQTEIEGLSIRHNQQVLRCLPEASSLYTKAVTGKNQETSPRICAVDEAQECSMLGFGSQPRQAQLFASCSYLEGGGKKSGSDGKESESSSTSTELDSLNKKTHPLMDPYMPKVMQRINCNVEPLQYGVILSGKLWSSSQAIFPKGYRSRVQYMSISDPAEMCDYISEILDAGLIGPLFMVFAEKCPSEVFIHVTAIKCWDMVRERVNIQIIKQQKMGRVNIPSVQAPGLVDGLKMYGLTSPAIIQAIEALDQNRVCTEYWRSRSKTQPGSISVTPSGNHMLSHSKESCSKELSPLISSEVVLRGLLKKANPEELHVLHNLLSHKASSFKDAAAGLVMEEIRGRS